MISFKPLLILYLIITSFGLSVCSNEETNIGKKEYSETLSSIPNEIWSKLKEYFPEIGLAALFSKASFIDSIGKIFSLIGNGISYAYSSFYSVILETFGAKVAGVFVISTYVVVVVVVVGGVYTLYKVSTKDNSSIKLGSFEVKSGDGNTKTDNNKE